MGHAHSHAHAEDAQSYYVDQLCTVGICATLGGVAIMVYRQGMLTNILVPAFQWEVLVTGIVLLAFAVIRGIALWTSVGKTGAAAGHSHGPENGHTHGPDCDHDHHHDHAHEHGPDCKHDHGHAHEHELDLKHAVQTRPAPAPGGQFDHDHGHAHGPNDENDHGHSHAWNPAKYAVLLLPIVLYFLNLPNEQFSAAYANHTMSKDQLLDEKIANVEDRGRVELGFKELERAAFLENQRHFFEGKTGVLRGQFVPTSNAHVFRLVRWKMVCCSADARPLNVRIIAPVELTGIPAEQWVEVEGQIQFRKNDRDEYTPVLQLKSANDIRKIPPETNPYLP